MDRKQLFASLLLGALAEITLLGVFVFVDEPPQVGRRTVPFHPWEFAYLAVPLVLLLAAAFMPVRAFLRGKGARS